MKKMKFVSLGVIMLASILGSTRTMGEELKAGGFSNPFEGVRLGSVVKDNGKIDGKTDVLDLSKYLNFTKCSVESTGETLFTGNSTYSKSAQMHSASLSMAGKYGVPSVASYSASISASYGQSFAEDKQTISISAMYAGTNSILTTNWGTFTPGMFLTCLSSALTYDDYGDGILMDILNDYQTAMGEIESTGQISPKTFKSLNSDLNSFKKDYGTGFVSGVIIGGLAGVRMELEKSSSSLSKKYSTSASFSGSGIGSSFSLAAAYGGQTDSSKCATNVNVSSVYLGGAAYQKYASDYQALFVGKALADLWSKDIASGPSIADLSDKTKITIPELVTPKKDKKLADAFGPITDADCFDKYTEALQYDEWAKTNPEGNFETFKKWKQEQVKKQQSKIAGLDVIVEEDEDDEFNANLQLGTLYPEFSDSTIATKSRETTFEEVTSTKNVVRSERIKALMEEKKKTNDELWKDLLNSNSVTGVIITRWVDVLPQLAAAENLLTTNIQLDDVKSLLNAKKVVQNFQNMGTMYDIASTCDCLNPSQWNQLSSTFKNYAEKLGKEINQETDLTSEKIDNIVKKFRTDKMDDKYVKMYDAFVKYKGLFSDGEMGYGAFWTYTSETNTAVYLFDHEQSRSTKTGTGTTWSGIGCRKYPLNAAETSNPSTYSEAVKCYPILLDDGERFVIAVKCPEADTVLSSQGLMAIEFPQSFALQDLNVSQVKKFASNKNKSIYTIDLQVKEHDGWSLWSTKNKGVTTYIIVRMENNPATKELINCWSLEEWIGIIKNPKIKITMIPFSSDELSTDCKWKGFSAYKSMARSPVLDNLIQLKEGLKQRQDSYYWSEANDRRIDVNKRYSPADMDKYSYYISFTEHPNIFN